MSARGAGSPDDSAPAAERPGNPIARAPRHAVPRFTIRERCAACGKPMLPGHATRVAALAEGSFVVHAACAASGA